MTFQWSCMLLWSSAVSQNVEASYIFRDQNTIVSGFPFKMDGNLGTSYKESTMKRKNMKYFNVWLI